MSAPGTKARYITAGLTDLPALIRQYHDNERALRLLRHKYASTHSAVTAKAIGRREHDRLVAETSARAFGGPGAQTLIEALIEERTMLEQLNATMVPAESYVRLDRARQIIRFYSDSQGPKYIFVDLGV
jgi:hypothetical protein